MSTSILFFVNNGSGSKIGKKITEINSKLTFKIELQSNYLQNQKPESIEVDLYIFEMKKSSKQGFFTAKQLISQNKKVLGIICGGDGTVSWVINQISQYGIDQQKMPFAIVPFGTGNDFSQNLGWGAKKFDMMKNDFEELKSCIKDWLCAKQVYLDIWQIQAEVRSYGKFEKIMLGKNEQLSEKKLNRIFVNYFSFGFDGKVGYTFDKHRTTFRLCNLCVYGLLGCLKSMTTIKRIQQLVSVIKVKKPSNKKINYIQNDNDIVDSNEYEQQIVYENDNNDTKIHDNVNFLALNINSYMGGVKDIWKNSSSLDKNNKYNLQSSYNDGKLQFVSFPYSFAIAFQKIFGGFAKRVYQGQGPIEILFKEYDESLNHHTYLQFDGQFIRFTHPYRIKIQRSNILPLKRFKVLVNQKK